MSVPSKKFFIFFETKEGNNFGNSSCNTVHNYSQVNILLIPIHTISPSLFHQAPPNSTIVIISLKNDNTNRNY